MKRTIFAVTMVVIILFTLPVSAFAGGLQDGRVVMGGTYILSSGETLDGDLAVIGGVATLEKDSIVKGDVVVIGGNLDAQGEIEGNLVVVGGNADLGPSTLVHGDAMVFGGNLNVGDARIEGDMVSGEGLEIPFDFDDFEFDNFDFRFKRWEGMPIRMIPGFRISTQARVLGYLFFCFMLAALAVLIVIFWPKPTSRIASAVIGHPVVAGGLGLLTAIVAPVLLLLLIFTVCLIPVSIVGGILLVVMAVFGWIALGLEVGRRLGIALDQDFQPVVAAGLGTLVFSLVVMGFMFIPLVGWIVPFLAIAVGLGGVFLTRLGTQAYIPSARTTPSEDEASLVEVPPPDAPEEERDSS